jgi:microcin C transport system ATP-binding protein
MPTTPASQSSTNSLLSIENLSIWFGASRVVSDLSLQIRKGEKFGLVGESGSGKSVTALSILKLVDGAHYGGAIRFDGQELLTASERQMRGLRGSRIAMIFQEPMTSLNPLYPIGDQVAEVITTHEAVSRHVAFARAIELLRTTGISEPDQRARAFPHQLSGGQRQRAMISMALACRPDLLIADEPTTALDVTIQAQVLALLDDLQCEYGMAVLFITHDLNLARRFTSRVGVMERGALVETGPTEQVLTHPAHPYTKHLVDSRPTREVLPVEANARNVLSGRGIRVEFRTRGDFLRSRRFTAVSDVNLDLACAETLGVVGESGSGKTTLGMALLALQPLTAGEVRLEGKRIDNARREILANARRKIQVVFQDPFASLSPRRTVEQIVGEGLEEHFPKLDKPQRTTRVKAALAEVGLREDEIPELLGRYPHEFSGGQRQRIAIARAMVIEPEVLILDEPTSALDASVQRQILSLLNHLQRKFGTSFVLISHDLAVIRAMAHRIAVMKDGAIVEEAETQALFTTPAMDYTRKLIRAAGLADGLHSRP